MVGFILVQFVGWVEKPAIPSHILRLALEKVGKRGLLVDEKSVPFSEIFFRAMSGDVGRFLR